MTSHPVSAKSPGSSSNAKPSLELGQKLVQINTRVKSISKQPLVAIAGGSLATTRAHQSA